MTFKQFNSPHSHSDHSLDGGSTLGRIAKRNKELGATHICSTEHGNINGAMDLLSAAKDHGLKPVFGCEVYLESPFRDYLQSMYEATVPDGPKKASTVERRVRESYVHLTVHFKTYEAYQAFCRLTPTMEARAVVKYGERKPIITLEELAALPDKVICSGCLIGAVQRWVCPFKVAGRSILEPQYIRRDLAELAYQQIRSLVAPGDFFVEVFPHKIVQDWHAPKFAPNGTIIEQGRFVANECSPIFIDGDYQRVANELVLQLAQKYGDKVLISADSHFAYPEDRVVQEARLSNGKESWKFSNSYHVLPSAEAASVLRETLGVSDRTIEEWIDNSYDWASRFDHFKMITSKDRWFLPEAPPDYMKKLRAAIDRYGRMRWDDQEMVERLKREVQVLANNGTLNLLPYFFTVEDIANFCRENDVLINVRGSAGGSLLLYLLGVSAVNPLKHGLSFERFLTLGRIKSKQMPDADLDFSTGGRDKVVAYLESKYGDRIARISTETQMKLKSSIKDAERAILGAVRPETEALCKSLPLEGQGASTRQLVFGYEDKSGAHVPGLLETNPKLKAYADSNPEVWATVTQMLGIQRNRSQHPCGFVIADRPVQDVVPITQIGDDKVTGFAPKSIETAGLIKYDFLGLNTLFDIQAALASIKERTGEVIDPWTLPDDPEVYEQFALGRTESVFQFDTDTVRPYLVATRPKSRDDLANITALCRPGCLDAPSGDGRTLAQVYVARAKGEPVSYVHEDLAEIFSPTLGIALFQEQSLQIFKKLAGYDDERAETVRRGIGKKDEKVLASCMADLRQGCLARGWSDAQVELLIEQIMASARYSFNKSHSVSYAYVAYACMYLKTKYKLDWWKAVLSNASKDDLVSKFWRYVRDFTSTPDINLSKDSFTIVNDGLLAPISIITGVGEKAFQQLTGGAPYRDLRHFVEAHMGQKGAKSAVHSGVVHRLIAAGVLDSLFPPGLPLASKIEQFELVKAEVKNAKVEPVPTKFVGVTELGDYLLRKSMVRVYSRELAPLVAPPRGGRQNGKGRWILPVGSQEYPVVTGSELEKLKENVAAGKGAAYQFIVLAYVVEEKTQAYKNKQKVMTKLVLDADGHFFEDVLWPRYEENIADTGFKGQPVAVIYKMQPDRLGIKSVLKLLNPTDDERYDVL